MDIDEIEDDSFYGRFCLRTTLHGFADFYLAQGKMQKTFWFLIMLGACVAIVYYNYMLIATFLSKPSATLISYNDVERIQFPNITICSSQMFNATFVKNSLQFDAQALMWLAMEQQDPDNIKTNFINYLSAQLLNFVSFDRTNDAQLIKVLETIYLKIFKPNDTTPTNIYDFYYAAGFECSSFLKQCSFAGKFFNCCKFARPLITVYGVCYQMHFETDESSGAFQTVDGSDQGFDITVRVNNSCGAQADRQTRLDVNQENSIILYASDYSSLLEYNPMLIQPETHATVRIMATQHFVNRDTDQCYDKADSFKLAYREAYTTNLCRQECAGNVSLAECQCYDPVYYVTAPPDIVCTPFQTMNCVVPLMYGSSSADSLAKVQSCINAKCLKTCEYWLYEPSVLYSEINLKGENTFEATETKLTVYYGQRQYLSVEEKLLMDTETFVSNVGGICGLWLGMSLISVVQFFYILLCGPCEKRNKRKLIADEEKKRRNQVYPIGFATTPDGGMAPVYIH